MSYSYLMEIFRVREIGIVELKERWFKGVPMRTIGSKRIRLLLLAALAAALATAGAVVWWQQQQKVDISNVVMNAGGATFPAPQVIAWVEQFRKERGTVINYRAIGSGAGQAQFFDGTLDFACSDPPLKTSDWEKYRGKVLQIPWLMGAVVITYNIPEIGNHSLKLTPEIVARIYKGEIAYWDDPSIKSLNPEIADKLPHKEIIAVYRSDSSGTTEVFTTFLNKAAPDIWPKQLVGKVVDWPAAKLGRAVGGPGNAGVMQAVRANPYSIGYVEWNYAIEQKTPMAAIRNAAGKFVLPSNEGIAAAAAGAKLPSSPLDNFDGVTAAVVYAPGENAYPISSFTFIILWSSYEDKLKAIALSEFLTWVANEGYRNVVPGYAAPPENVRQLLLEAARILKGG